MSNSTYRGDSVSFTQTFLAAAAAGILLGGCASNDGYRRPRNAQAQAQRSIVIDGDLGEWAEDAAGTADQDYLYFRVAQGEDAFPLQAGPQSLTLWLDTDGDRATGRQLGDPAQSAWLGVELEIHFSPTTEEGVQRGVALTAYDYAGREWPVSHADVDLLALPTYAAAWYEGRISRHIETEFGPLVGLADRGTARGMFVVLDEHDAVELSTDLFEINKPVASDAAPLANADLPAKAPGTVRVVSYNVLRGSPMENPEPFARVFAAIDADIALIQEWDGGNAGTLESWFTALVPTQSGWSALAGEGGVAVVAQHEMAPLGPASLSTGERTVRFIGANVLTPHGSVGVTSVHLKCCGTKGSQEDQDRSAEAELVNAIFFDAFANEGITTRIIGGDMNLVGSRTPLDILKQRLAEGETDMDIAEARVLGDGTAYTWRDASSVFPNGRLDYVVSTGAHVVQAFTLDTARLSDAALARLGLDRTDTSVSDHLPVVIDLIPTQTATAVAD